MLEFLSDGYPLWVVVFLTAAAFAAGFLDSIAGGAGLILVPAALIAGLPPHLALGQEKLVSTVGTVAAMWNFFRSQKVVWKIAVLGIPLSLLGAYVGAEIILFLERDIVRIVILCMLPIGLLLTLMPKKPRANYATVATWGGRVILTTSLVAFVVGFYDGFFGPGTGSMFILALYFILHMSFVEASATSKVFNFASNVGAFGAFFVAGEMLFGLGLPMIAGSFLGNYIGSRLTISKGDKIVRGALIVALGLLFATLAWQTFGVAAE